MQLVAAVGSLLLILLILWDAFETIVLPRRVSRRIRLVRLFYRATWIPWRAVARRMSGGQREAILAVYGSLALLLLFMVWAAGLIVGFAGLYWALSPPGAMSFTQTLYFSGSTLFPLGGADAPLPTPLIETAEVVEAGLGVGFFIVVVGYLPVMYDAFSRREVRISLLDARAGSPPTAVELLRRLTWSQGPDGVSQVLHDLELWCAELLESHLSYPAVAYFRSQHDNQSWLAALTMVLDLSSLVMAGIDGVPKGQAQLTYAMSRHAAVDLAQVFRTPPRAPQPDRLPSADLSLLRQVLLAAGVRLREGEAVERELTELRRAYEPYVGALASFLLLALPPWIPSEVLDSWQTSAWDHAGDATRGPRERESPGAPGEALRRGRKGPYGDAGTAIGRRDESLTP